MPDEEAGTQAEAATAKYRSPWEITSGRKRSSILDWLKGSLLSPLPPLTARNNLPAEESAPAPSLGPGATNADANANEDKWVPASRLDGLFRPDRTYLGLERNRFVLFVVIPAVSVILIILPVALGIGLTRQRGAENIIPLPSREGPWEGDLTFYDPGLGACGWDSKDDEMIVSVSHALWDSAQRDENPNHNPLCGRKIRVGRGSAGETRGEQTVEVTVVDRCPGCEATDLDVSPAVFRRLARVEDGRVPATWDWVR
ncbi:related to B2-aldehyde-forming enzyme [Cephalotrichum gorgonifer]|uniref:Related to B2-aldehyde-forming enzyme n=1 Tax=Cephalotrichum gorgonifer TaxID=2041049 RepID=A0AAE8N406_9PEZI|nr:related to B2-aldehyde-forming enzyme [Cephalotrichum gorgonifer]